MRRCKTLTSFAPRSQLAAASAGEFQTQLSDTLSHHHEELQRRSDSLYEDLKHTH